MQLSLKTPVTICDQPSPWKGEGAKIPLLGRERPGEGR